MPHSRPLSRLSTGLCAVATTAALLAGCAAMPTPTPTPAAAFESEEEAFAAAEKTYRAYNDAVNAQRAGESHTLAQSFLIGLALEQDLATDQQLDEGGLTLQGASSVETFAGDRASVRASPATVAATVCLDVSRTRVLDRDKQDVTPESRPERVLLNVEFVESDSRLLISRSSLVESVTC